MPSRCCYATSPPLRLTHVLLPLLCFSISTPHPIVFCLFCIHPCVFPILSRCSLTYMGLIRSPPCAVSAVIYTIVMLPYDGAHIVMGSLLYIRSTYVSDERRREMGGEQFGLCVVSHNAHKLLFVDLAVLVKIKLVDHRLSNHVSSQNQNQQKKTTGRHTTRPPPDGPRCLSRRVVGYVSKSFPCYHHRTTGTRDESRP